MSIALAYLVASKELIIGLVLWALPSKKSKAVALQVQPDCSAESKLSTYQDKTDGKIDKLVDAVGEIAVELRGMSTTITHEVKRMHDCLDKTGARMDEANARQDVLASERHAELRQDIKEVAKRSDDQVAKLSGRIDSTLSNNRAQN